MKKTVQLKNVVKAESVVITTYPQWSDYGCLTKALRVIYKDDEGKYIETCLVTENIDPWIDYYEVEIINYISDEEYRERKLNDRVGKSSAYAEKGDKIKVIKGRKFPIGTIFTCKEKKSWEDRYGRTQTYYWITEEGTKVNVDNCIIVR